MFNRFPLLKNSLILLLCTLLLATCRVVNTEEVNYLTEIPNSVFSIYNRDGCKGRLADSITIVDLATDGCSITIRNTGGISELELRKDHFGEIVTFSGDGHTLAIAAPNEASDASGVNGDEKNNSVESSGVVYLYKRIDSIWTQQAYIKASNTDVDDYFGSSIALSHNGNTLAVGAVLEDSDATNQSDNSKSNSGAVYIFSRTGDSWGQQAYVKASNASAEDRFGNAVTLSDDGNTLAIAAWFEADAETVIEQEYIGDTATSSGAVYVFKRAGTAWSQQAFIMPNDVDSSSLFGVSLNFDSNGNRLEIGAWEESSFSDSGRIYVYQHDGVGWNQQAYLMSSHSKISAKQGYSLVPSNITNKSEDLFTKLNTTGID